MQIAGFDWVDGNWSKCGQHGVSREQIERLFLEGGIRIAPDLRHSTTTKSRPITVGRIDGRAMFVAFAFRGDLIRLISARFMHAKEAKSYETST